MYRTSQWKVARNEKNIKRYPQHDYDSKKRSKNIVT